MHEDDELPYIARATTSGILEFQAAVRTLLPDHYEYTPENAALLDLLFKARRHSSMERAPKRTEDASSTLADGPRVWTLV